MGTSTRVTDVMGTPPVVVRPGLCLRDVAMSLRDAKVGAAVVLDHGRVQGMISERDIVGALADGADPDAIWASDVMTPDPVWAEPDDSLERAMDLMVTAGLRHLPVITESTLLGVLSLRDLVAVASTPPPS